MKYFPQCIAPQVYKRRLEEKENAPLLRQAEILFMPIFTEAAIFVVDNRFASPSRPLTADTPVSFTPPQAVSFSAADAAAVAMLFVGRTCLSEL